VYVSQVIGNDLTGEGTQLKPYATLQKGMTETQTGGSIFVGGGFYFGRYQIDRSMNLLGGYEQVTWTRDIDVNLCFLDAQELGTVIDISGEDVEALVEGFVIRGGEKVGDGYGAGIIIRDNAEAIIRYNTIRDNKADFVGAGITAYQVGYREIIIDANNIYDNTSRGIWEISSCKGAKLLEGAAPGGGLLVSGGPVTISNNFIHHNINENLGGDGLAIVNQKESVKIINNTIADNGGAAGEGLSLASSSRSQIFLYNNLFVGHFIGVQIESATGLEQDYSGYFDNAINVNGWLPGLHDVYGDPCFTIRSSGFYHIRHCSASKDQGIWKPHYTTDHDVDGDMRPYGIGVDIGADETMSNSPPYFEFVSPSGKNCAAFYSFTIEWIDEDIDDNASIQLYYDADKTYFYGAHFIGSTSEDDPADEWDWDTSAVPEGIYWIVAVVSDSHNKTMHAYSPYPVKVTKITPQMIIEHLLGRTEIVLSRIPLADLNNDGIINIADYIVLITLM